MNYVSFAKNWNTLSNRYPEAAPLRQPLLAAVPHRQPHPRVSEPQVQTDGDMAPQGGTQDSGVSRG